MSLSAVTTSVMTPVPFGCTASVTLESTRHDVKASTAANDAAMRAITVRVTRQGQ